MAFKPAMEPIKKNLYIRLLHCTWVFISCICKSNFCHILLYFLVQCQVYNVPLILFLPPFLFILSPSLAFLCQTAVPYESKQPKPRKNKVANLCFILLSCNFLGSLLIKIKMLGTCKLAFIVFFFLL